MKKDITLKCKNGKFRIFALSDTHVLANGDRRITRDIDAIVRAIVLRNTEEAQRIVKLHIDNQYRTINRALGIRS